MPLFNTSEDLFGYTNKTGTTILAAEPTDRRAICVEIEPRYCDVIRKRLAEFATAKDAPGQI